MFVISCITQNQKQQNVGSSVSKLNNIILGSITDADMVIEDMYIKTRQLSYAGCFTETSRFPWSDKSQWLVKSGQIGTYLYFLDGKLVYVGQGGMRSRLSQSFSAFEKYKKEYGSRVVPWKKADEKWIITPKIYNMCRNMKRWEISCIHYHTGDKRIDKEYAKKTEDNYIIKYNLPKYGLNMKKGDVT